MKHSSNPYSDPELSRRFRNSQPAGLLPEVTMAKKYTKKCAARVKLLFSVLNKPIAFLPFSLPSPQSLLKLPMVVIQTFCYPSNVTSNFSSL